MPYIRNRKMFACTLRSVTYIIVYKSSVNQYSLFFFHRAGDGSCVHAALQCLGLVSVVVFLYYRLNMKVAVT